MAQTINISPKEIERVGALAYGGKTIKVMLCNVGLTGYTSSSTVANWQSVELSGGGYTRFSQSIPTGSYSNSVGAFVIPDIDASFTSSTGASFDRIVIYIDGELYVHSVIAESPNISIASGQTITYRISLRSDD